MPRRLVPKTAFALWIAATLGAACAIPYAESLAPSLDKAAHTLHVPVFVVVALSVAQSGVMLALMTFLGLWAAGTLGMGAPWIDALFGEGAPPPGLGRVALLSIALGAASGVALFALDHWVFFALAFPEAAARHAHSTTTTPPLWPAALGTFEGGITEEVELRLFMLSLLGLGTRALQRLVTRRRDDDIFPSAAFWIANVLAAILFGLGHLPMTAHLTPLTPIVITRAVVLNGGLGVVAGWLFRRYGLEAAMMCHAATDIVLHVVGPAVRQALSTG